MIVLVLLCLNCCMSKVLALTRVHRNRCADAAPVLSAVALGNYKEGIRWGASRPAEQKKHQVHHAHLSSHRLAGIAPHMRTCALPLTLTLTLTCMGAVALRSCCNCTGATAGATHCVQIQRKVTTGNIVRHAGCDGLVVRE
jgi:hypothetical protein